MPDGFFLIVLVISGASYRQKSLTENLSSTLWCPFLWRAGFQRCRTTQSSAHMMIRCPVYLKKLSEKQSGLFWDLRFAAFMFPIKAALFIDWLHISNHLWKSSNFGEIYMLSRIDHIVRIISGVKIIVPPHLQESYSNSVACSPLPIYCLISFRIKEQD